MNNNIEIEIQVNIENSKGLVEFLENEAEFKYEKRQIDEYFTPAHRDFLSIRPVKEWLRLRNTDGKYSLNYKNWHYDKDGKSNYCDEYETAVVDISAIKNILQILNFNLLVRVDKIRKIWDYKDYEASLDSVKELGDFVEIEYKGGDNVDPKKITEEMIKFLKQHNCGEIKRNYKGYPFLLLFPEEVDYEIQ